MCVPGFQKKARAKTNLFWPCHGVRYRAVSGLLYRISVDLPASDPIKLLRFTKFLEPVLERSISRIWNGSLKDPSERFGMCLRDCQIPVIDLIEVQPPQKEIYSLLKPTLLCVTGYVVNEFGELRPIQSLPLLKSRKPVLIRLRRQAICEILDGRFHLSTRMINGMQYGLFRLCARLSESF